MKRTWLPCVVAIAMAVAVGAVARWRAAPIGLTNDDAAYALSARALAGSQGFVNLRRRDRPPPALYPIGFPAILALVIAGAPDVSAQLRRLVWVGPLASVAFILCSFYWLRRRSGGDFYALLGTLLVATHPTTLRLASLLMSDLLFGALLLLALALAEDWLADDAPPRLGFLSGCVLALPCLIRFAGFAALLALGITVALRGNRRAMVACAAGVSVVLAPWLVFRLVVGGETYWAEYAHRLAGVSLPVASAAGFKAVMAVALPALFLPPPAPPVGHVVACVLDTVVLIGIVAWLRRRGETRLQPLAALCMLVLAAAWSIAWSDAGLARRLLQPIAPLLLYAGALGCGSLGIRRGTWWAHVAAAAALLATASHALLAPPLPQYDAGAYRAAFAAAAELVPDGDIVACSHADMLTLHSEKYSLYLPVQLTPAALHAFVGAGQARYVMLLPDDDADVIDEYDRQYPGELSVLWSRDRFQLRGTARAEGPR